MNFEHPCHLVNVRDLIINKSLPVPQGARIQEQSWHALLFSVWKPQRFTGVEICITGKSLTQSSFVSFLLPGNSYIYQYGECFNFI